MKFREALGEVLRELRHNKGLPLRVVSKAANISVGYLSEVERGVKEISSEYLYGLAKTLGVTPSHLVIETGYKMSAYELDKVLRYEDEYSDLIVTHLLPSELDFSRN